MLCQWKQLSSTYGLFACAALPDIACTVMWFCPFLCVHYDTIVGRPALLDAPNISVFVFVTLYLFICLCVFLFVNLSLCICLCVYVLWIFICVFVFMYLFLWICICVFVMMSPCCGQPALLDLLDEYFKNPSIQISNENCQNLQDKGKICSQLQL